MRHWPRRRQASGTVALRPLRPLRDLDAPELDEDDDGGDEPD
ncbi:hypothetical protein ACWC24_40305 [Streptomyces sp. NPDC001443]